MNFILIYLYISFINKYLYKKLRLMEILDDREKIELYISCR